MAYKGLQGVTGSYKGLQGVTRGYKGLQGVTRGYRGLQKVTGGYKALQGFYKGLHKFLGNKFNSNHHLIILVTFQLEMLTRKNRNTLLTGSLYFEMVDLH